MAHTGKHDNDSTLISFMANSLHSQLQITVRDKQTRQKNKHIFSLYHTDLITSTLTSFFNLYSSSHDELRVVFGYVK